MTNPLTVAVEALTLAEDVLSRSPYSSEIWPDGTHPNTGIEKMREALATLKTAQEEQAPSRPSQEWREAAARIIDPDAFRPVQIGLSDYAHVNRFKMAEAARTKADQIVALQPPTGHEGEAVAEIVTTYKPQAIHYEDRDVLEYVVRDAPTIARNAVAGDLDVLLDMRTREPIGWCVYGWSKKKPTPTISEASVEEVARLQRDIAEIMVGLVKGEIGGEDVVWASGVETLWERCASILAPGDDVEFDPEETDVEAILAKLGAAR